MRPTVEVWRDWILKAHGKEFGSDSQCSGKPMEDFKQVRNIIRFMFARVFVCIFLTMALAHISKVGFPKCEGTQMNLRP